MPLPVPIGIDDFRKLREGGLEYIDKTHFIRELLDLRGVEVALVPRPRRFGKSLNLSTLRWFFEKRGEDLSHLFKDLSIWQAGELYRAHFQRYPVIYLTLKGAQHDTFDACWGSLRKKIQVLFDETIRETTRMLTILSERFDVPEIAHVSGYVNVCRNVTRSCGLKRNFGFVITARGRSKTRVRCTRSSSPMPSTGRRPIISGKTSISTSTSSTSPRSRFATAS
jgi:Predicted AAA-ATPase